MTGPGRPTRDEVAQRRQRIRLFLVVSTAASDEAVRRLAEKLDVGERAVRSDLEAIRDEIEHSPSPTLKQSLLEAIEVASTFQHLEELGKKVMCEMVKGTIDRPLGSALTEAVREQRHVLHDVRKEKAHAAIKALEVLTPGEQEALRKYRETMTPASLKPGEFPPPPDGASQPSLETHAEVPAAAPSSPSKGEPPAMPVEATS